MLSPVLIVALTGALATEPPPKITGDALLKRLTNGAKTVDAGALCDLESVCNTGDGGTCPHLGRSTPVPRKTAARARACLSGKHTTCGQVLQCLGVPYSYKKGSALSPSAFRADGSLDVVSMCRLAETCRIDSAAACEKYTRENPPRPAELATLRTCLATASSCGQARRCLNNAGPDTIPKLSHWVSGGGDLEITRAFERLQRATCACETLKCGMAAANQMAELARKFGGRKISRRASKRVEAAAKAMSKCLQTLAEKRQ